MSPLELPVPALLHVLKRALPSLEGGPIEPLLVRARCMDALRDALVIPPLAAALDQSCADLDEGAWRRLALLGELASDEALRPALAEAVRGEARPGEFWEEGFLGFVRSMDLHTIPLLRESQHRLEEFARAWMLRAGIAVTGETPAQSLERLERLDYARLLSEVERARRGADDRLEYLRKLQEKADRLLAPRGKW